MTEPKRIYEYTDYRQYLAESYKARKSFGPHYSHRAMAGQLGFSSPNFVKLITDGQRGLGRKSLPMVTKALGLRRKEAECFSYLVSFAHAGSSVDKNYCFGLIAAFRASAVADQFEYSGAWYNCVVRELIKGLADDIDYAAPAKRVRPAIHVNEARKAVELLEELGLVERDGEGRYAPSSRVITTDNEPASFGVRGCHEAMIELGRKSIGTVPSEDRDVSSATLHISAQGFRKIKERIKELWQELLQVARDDRDADRVCQTNFQLFPVSAEG